MTRCSIVLSMDPPIFIKETSRVLREEAAQDSRFLFISKRAEVLHSTAEMVIRS